MNKALIIRLLLLFFSLILFAILWRYVSLDTVHLAKPVDTLKLRQCPYGMTSEYADRFILRCYWFHAHSGLSSEQIPPKQVASKQIAFKQIIPKQAASNQNLPARAQQDRFRLPVVVISPRSQPENAPLVFVSGGPGEGFNTSEARLLEWLDFAREVDLKRDLVLYDARGTGGSSPSWRCPELLVQSEQILQNDLKLNEEMALENSILRHCLKQMHEELYERFKAGFSLFSSRYQAQDLNALVKALGYSRWHFWGVSYGTRVALLAASESKGLASLVLDSPYPPGRGGQRDWPLLYKNMMSLHQRQFTAMAKSIDKAGNRVNPRDESFEQLLSRALFQLQRHKVYGEIEIWRSETKNYRFLLTPDRLLSLSYHVLYDSSLLEGFYRGLIHLAQGAGALPEDLRPSVSSFLTQVFDEQFNHLVYFATECSDQALIAAEAFESRLSASELPTLLEQNLRSLWQGDICRDALFKREFELQTAVELRLPVLMYSGELDPVTPPSYALELGRVLPNGTLYMFPQQGHAVTNSSACARKALIAFMDSPEQAQSDPCLLAEASMLSSPGRSSMPLSDEKITEKRIDAMRSNYEEKTMSEEPIWIDVRTAKEFASGHYPGAIHIPYEEIGSQIEAITADKGAAINVYCRTGRRSGIARDILSQMGYTLVENKGGLDDVMSGH